MFPKPTDVNELITKYNDAKYESIESGPPLIFSGRHSKKMSSKSSPKYQHQHHRRRQKGNDC